MQRTIIFCANEEAAERMRKEIANLNADMMRKNPDYVVRITSSDNYGKSKLEYFTSVDSEYPVIATTSELLSTGVDTKTVQLIVLDKNVSSMTQFKQIIGRGTRIREDKGKLSFTVMDFRGVSSLDCSLIQNGTVLWIFPQTLTLKRKLQCINRRLRHTKSNL